MLWSGIDEKSKVYMIPGAFNMMPRKISDHPQYSPIKESGYILV